MDVVQHPKFNGLAIPIEWKLVTLEDVCERMKQGKILPQKMIFPNGTFPVYGANGCIGFCEEFFLDEDRVLITCRGSTCGTVNMTKGKSFVTNNAMILFERSFLHKHFLFFVLQEFSTKVLKVGSGQPQLTKGILNSHQIPIPPLPEQRRIAAVLSLVQRAIEQQERLIALTTELKKALMHKLFTEGTRGEPQKQTEIGPIPENWEIVELGELVSTKIVDGVHKTPSYVDTGIPFITAKDILDNEVRFEECRFVAEEEHKQLTKRTKPQMGDVLLSKVGTVGKVALVDFHSEFSIFVQIALIRPKTDLMKSNYAYWILQSDAVQLEILSNAPQSTMKFIGTQKISKIRIPLPSKQEQDQVTKILRTIQQKLKHLQNRREQLTSLFRTLLHQLMTAEIRVNDLDLEELDILEQAV